MYGPCFGQTIKNDLLVFFSLSDFDGFEVNLHVILIVFFNLSYGILLFFEWADRISL